MPNDKTTINVGVTFTPIVQSVNTADVNETIKVQLISGLNHYDIVWECNGIIVQTNPDSTVVFTVPGTYKPRVMGHLLEVSQYWITVG